MKMNNIHSFKNNNTKRERELKWNDIKDGDVFEYLSNGKSNGKLWILHKTSNSFYLESLIGTKRKLTMFILNRSYKKLKERLDF